jgi:O-antigen ligase
MVGIIILLIVLYFPIFPNVPIGSLEFSPSMPIVVILFLSALLRMLKQRSGVLTRWQWNSLLALFTVFILATLFSTSLSVSLLFLPNLMIYLLLLFAIMVLVDTPDKLWTIVRVILILGFILSIWRGELSPLRGLLQLPSLGTNGAVFTFHPAVALAWVILVFMPSAKMISFPWRIFSLITLFSLIVHGIIIQTRSAWLAWILLGLLITWQARGKARLVMFFLALLIGIMSIFLFSDIINNNWEQTQGTFDAVVNQDRTKIGSDDLVRLYARDAGLAMFRERPIFGWGPNLWSRLKPEFVENFSKEARNSGAFNAWLIYLIEMGGVTVTIVLIIFLIPLFTTLKIINVHREDPLVVIAFGFALGTLAIGIHLLFISLFYSFAWAQVGFALAAVRLIENKKI